MQQMAIQMRYCQVLPSSRFSDQPLHRREQLLIPQIKVRKRRITNVLSAASCLQELGETVGSKVRFSWHPRKRHCTGSSPVQRNATMLPPRPQTSSFSHDSCRYLRKLAAFDWFGLQDFCFVSTPDGIFKQIIICPGMGTFLRHHLPCPQAIATIQQSETNQTFITFEPSILSKETVTWWRVALNSALNNKVIRPSL